MTRWLAPLTLVAASTLLGGCIEERVAYVRAVPQQEAAEIVEVSPGAGSVYVSGHWEWNGASYQWVRAHYIRRPQPNVAWVEGHWKDSPKGWYWETGHWAQPHAVHPPKAYRPRPQPAPAPQAPPESNEAPEGEMQTDPNVPPAPTYAPPPPPAVIPPPPGGGVVQPQHYIQQPTPGIGY
jgi:YXWGXW repeat-containing protein